MIFIIKKITLIIALLTLIGGGIFVYVTSENPDKQEVSSPNVESSDTNLATIDQDQLRETLNLSFRIISAMLNEDYDYLEGVIDSSVTLDKENQSITFGSIHYEGPLLTGFDYENLEFRGYMVDGESIYIVLGVYNVSYEFEFVKEKSENSNYLLKSLLTN